MHGRRVIRQVIVWWERKDGNRCTTRSVSRTFRAKSPEHRRFFRNFISSLHVRTTPRRSRSSNFHCIFRGLNALSLPAVAKLLQPTFSARTRWAEKSEKRASGKRKEKSPCRGLIFSRFFIVFYALFARVSELYHALAWKKKKKKRKLAVVSQMANCRHVIIQISCLSLP